MQENFSQAINMLQNTTIDSEDLPSTQQANNISDTTVTNAQLLTFLKTLQNKVDRLESNTPSPTISTNSNINPRTGKEFKRYCFSYGCCLHWGGIVPRKNQDIRMMQHSKTEWVAVMRIVCPIVRDWWGEQTYNLIY